MKSGGKVLIQVLIVSLIGLASVVGVWLLLSQGASADADISVDKTADPTSLPAPGGDVTFTVRVDNIGVETVTLISLVDNPGSVNLHGKGDCVLTQTILAGGYYECSFTEAVSGSAGDYVDTVTAEAEDGEGNSDIASDSATVSITAGPLHHIKIESEAGGLGSEVNTHAMTTDDEFTVYAAGYDAHGNYIADQVVDWATTGTLDSQTGSGSSFTFAPSTADTSGTVTADAGGGMDDATGTITVNVGDLHHILICTDDAGQTPATDHTMTTDDTWPLYAAGYDADNNFIANQTVTWGETGDLDDVSGSSTSYTFSPSTADTSGTITADHATATDGETGTITVNPGALDYIVICRDANGQNPAYAHTMTTDDTWTLYAAGYDAEDNFRGNETATWDETGTLDNVSGSGTSYTFSPSTADTSGTITAEANGETDATGVITVNAGALDHIVIEDAAGGTGNEVNTHSLVVGGTFQVWAAGYDAENNYRSDVTVTWTGTGVVAGRLAPASGVSTTFTAEEAGTGTIEADDESGHTDATGTITVQTPVLTITKADNPDPVNAGATLAYTIIITNSGNADATTVIVAEHYDANVSFVYANPAPDASSGNRVWTFATLAVGDSQTIDIVVQVASPLPVGTILTNQATLDSDRTTPVTVTEFTSVTTASELTVSKVDVPDPVPAGGNLTYIISYHNGGTAPAEDVVITEAYDSQVTFVSANPAPRGGTDNVWDIGDLAVGDNGSIQVTVRVDTPLPDGSTLTNRVTIDSLHTSPLTYVEATGVSSPDLVITATHEPSIFSPGELMTYTVMYSNSGHWQAENVIITTTLPQNTTYVGHGWTSSDGQTYTYEDEDNLPSGANRQVYFVVRYAAQSQIDVVEFNTPFVVSESGSSGDANQGNNTTYVYIGVPDLVITDFSFEPDPLRPDVPVIFTIVLENQGTGPARNPAVKLPAGSWVDVFTRPVVSYPWVDYSNIFTSMPPLDPGAMYTVTILYTQGFTLQQIQDDVHGFYPKVDNHRQHPYGLVPEYNEMNNVRMHRVYLPLVFR